MSRKNRTKKYIQLIITHSFNGCCMVAIPATGAKLNEKKIRKKKMSHVHFAIEPVECIHTYEIVKSIRHVMRIAKFMRMKQ